MQSWNSVPYWFWVSLYPFILYSPSLSLSCFDSVQKTYLLFTHIHFSIHLFISFSLSLSFSLCIEDISIIYPYSFLYFIYYLPNSFLLGTLENQWVGREVIYVISVWKYFRWQCKTPEHPLSLKLWKRMLRRRCQKLKAAWIPEQPYSRQLNWLPVINK